MSLTALLDAGRLADAVHPDSPARPGLDAVGSRYTRRLQVQVCGRDGVGRDTFARALRERLSVTAIGPGDRDDGDADLWVLLLAGPPRAADLRWYADLPAARTIVVLGKADTFPDPSDVAARCARSLGTPVLPVSQVLACADLRDDEFAFLRALAAAGEEMPSMAARFRTPTGVSAGGDVLTDERALRTALLRRIDQSGIDLTLEMIAAGHSAAADADRLNATLHDLSGINAMSGLIRDRVDLVRRHRVAEVCRALELFAARGTDRDVMERLLADADVDPLRTEPTAGVR